MKLFDVYSLQSFEPVKAKGSYLWDSNGHKYLDFYGGHAVISIGHSHPFYVNRLKAQLDEIGFYSNSVINTKQEELSQKLGEVSGYDEYNLFLCNSGAEANENALKLASFVTGRKKVVCVEGSFHGRTSAAVAATDDASIQAPINASSNFIFVGMNDMDALKDAFSKNEIAAFIVEGIQGVVGIIEPSVAFLQLAETLCEQHSAILILDEVQSGFGRTGKFFAHQYASIKPHIITVAKGMGNGFPVAGVLIHPNIKAVSKMLGTTFGGNHLACVAATAVLQVIDEEALMQNALVQSEKLIATLKQFDIVKEVRGKGLMIGVELKIKAKDFNKILLQEHRVLAGLSSQENTLRILPSLAISNSEVEEFLAAFEKVCQTLNVAVS